MGFKVCGSATNSQQSLRSFGVWTLLWSSDLESTYKLMVQFHRKHTHWKVSEAWRTVTSVATFERYILFIFIPWYFAKWNPEIEMLQRDSWRLVRLTSWLKMNQRGLLWPPYSPTRTAFPCFSSFSSTPSYLVTCVNMRRCSKNKWVARLGCKRMSDVLARSRDMLILLNIVIRCKK